MPARISHEVSKMGVEATSTVISSMEAAGVIMASGAVVVWVSQFSDKV